MVGGGTQVLLGDELVCDYYTIDSRSYGCSKPAFGVLDNDCLVRLCPEPLQCSQVRIWRGLRANVVAFREYEAHVVHDRSTPVYQFKVRTFCGRDYRHLIRGREFLKHLDDT